MPVLATLALAGCGALFDSPDNSTVTPPTAVTEICPDGSTAATLADCSSPPVAMKECPNGMMIPIADICPPPVDIRQPACAANCPDNLVDSYLNSVNQKARFTYTYDSQSGVYAINKIGGGDAGLSFELYSGTGGSDVNENRRSATGNGDISARFFIFDSFTEKQYLAFGIWEQRSGGNNTPERGGFVVGEPLSADYKLPANGTARYVGFGAVEQNKGPLRYGGDVEFIANFNDGGDATLSGSYSEDSLNGVLFGFNFVGGVFSNGVFSGGTITCGVGCTGTPTGDWQAAFFGGAESGDAPSRLGGVFRGNAPGLVLTTGNSFSNVDFVGGFGARLQ